MKAIEFKDFSCYYKGKKKDEFYDALLHLTFSVDVGECVAIVGPSGSGKTTLLKCCLGLGEYFDGDLYIRETPIEQLDLRNNHYAYIQQNISLYPHLTVYENIAFPLRRMKIPPAEVDVRVKEIAEALDIPILLSRKPRELSVGQQQRVSIARALVKNPSFVFFDEPFSNIDQKQRVQLRQVIRRIHAAYRPTILFVTHDLEEAFAVSSRVIVLEEGKIVDDGTAETFRQTCHSGLLRAHFEQKAGFYETNDSGHG